MDSISPRRCRFFIVDNSEDLAWSLSEVLALEEDLEPAGYWTQGVDALKKALEAQADILILDYRLPDCTALTILEEARAAAVPFGILVYSGYLAEEMAAAAMANGAAGYLAKGGSPDALVQEIRRIHRARQAAPAPTS